MKTTKLPRQLAKNASKLHRFVGALLVSNSVFDNYEIRQEYSVSRVSDKWKSNREKFDWVILGLNVVIEAHGVQHYKEVKFGGISEEEAKRELRKLQNRDEKKQKAALEAGWAYVVVRYDELDTTREGLAERISEAIKSMVIERSKKDIEALGGKEKPKYKNKSPKPKKKGKYNWPTKKIPTRPFPKKRKKDDI